LAIHVKGLVQGVGFRPFVYRLAQEHHLHGWVVNGTDGVTIKVEGAASDMAPFVENLRNKAPVISQIDEMVIDQDMPEGLQGFFILASQDLTNETSEISPDIAVCPECIADMKVQDHRINYPFINCTNCGPRFSIINDFPYDRAKTTMSPFTMCPQCLKEYEEISDRRFHAQPVACNDCGPTYTMHAGKEVIDNLSEILERSVEMIGDGMVIALKGVGGYHLMCDALNTKAVKRLRIAKMRESKPFAVMFKDMDTIMEFAIAGEAEERAISSWRRPIVVLEQKKLLAQEITLGLHTIGAFLPYMPFHYMLFEKLHTPAIVLTSGNLANEPVIIKNEEALTVFQGIADAVITYNREIFNRSDDSVVRIISGGESIQRRSRGFAPEPLRLDFEVDGILAAGAELSNCFSIGKGNRAYLSQHIGDLKNLETFAFYEEAQARFQQLFRIKPVMIAADLHPDYLSTGFARKSGLPVKYIQHHHAHIASCMAEHGINEPVIGLAFDGTGYGTDGNSWGSEFMVCDYNRFERYSHFAYMPMPGSDRASEEPWRMGLSMLYQAFGDDLFNMDLPLLKSIDHGMLLKITASLKKGINCPLSSGAGRLFDAVAAITGICIHSTFHAEAPMRLESCIKQGVTDFYTIEIADQLSFVPVIRQICQDLLSKTDIGIIAARFHNTIVRASAETVMQIYNKTGIDKVVLSGGTFQNKYLLESLESCLAKNNLAVFTHHKVPCNDGGIALGQLVIASHLIN
jgi:hydrogenase maturation protein HypF